MRRDEPSSAGLPSFSNSDAKGRFNDYMWAEPEDVPSVVDFWWRPGEFQAAFT